MNLKKLDRRNTLSWTLYLILVLLSSCVAFDLWVASVGHLSSKGCVGGRCYLMGNFSAMVDQTAYKPYVARMLIPSHIRVLSLVLPQKIISSLEDVIVFLGFKKYLYDDGVVTRAPLVIWYLLIIISLCLLVEGMRRFLLTMYAGPRWFFIAISLPLPLFWSCLKAYHSYIYDPFTATLFIWTLYCALKGKWYAYYPLLIVTTLHKETSAIIPLAIAYFRFMHKKNDVFSFLIIQPILIVMLRLFLSYGVFRHNLGSFVDIHLFDHNLKPEAMIYLWKLFIIAVIVPFALYRWAEKPYQCRAALIMVLPLLPMAVIFGYFDEVRIYAEGLPGLVAALTCSFVSFIKPKSITKIAADSQPKNYQITVLLRANAKALYRGVRGFFTLGSFGSPKKFDFNHIKALIILSVGIWPIIYVELKDPEIFRKEKHITVNIPKLNPKNPNIWRYTSKIAFRSNEVLSFKLNGKTTITRLYIGIECDDTYLLLVKNGRYTRRHYIDARSKRCVHPTRRVIELSPAMEGVDKIQLMAISGNHFYKLNNLIIGI